MPFISCAVDCERLKFGALDNAWPSLIRVGFMKMLDTLTALQAENARLVALLEAHRIEWRMPPARNLSRMWHKRRRGYRAMGYRMTASLL